MVNSASVTLIYIAPGTCVSSMLAKLIVSSGGVGELRVAIVLLLCVVREALKPNPVTISRASATINILPISRVGNCLFIGKISRLFTHLPLYGFTVQGRAPAPTIYEAQHRSTRVL